MADTDPVPGTFCDVVNNPTVNAVNSTPVITIAIIASDPSFLKAILAHPPNCIIMQVLSINKRCSVGR
jgi:hypothetical protein